MTRAVAWISLVTWTTILAATDWVLATCDVDCSDSGALQGVMLLTVLAPAVAIGASYLVRSGPSAWSRGALLVLGGACAALIALLVIIFIGV
jgi:hypothetical protein